jgi:hypothetical protein
MFQKKNAHTNVTDTVALSCNFVDESNADRALAALAHDALTDPAAGAVRDVLLAECQRRRACRRSRTRRAQHSSRDPPRPQLPDLQAVALPIPALPTGGGGGGHAGVDAPPSLWMKPAGQGEGQGEGQDQGQGNAMVETSQTWQEKDDDDDDGRADEEESEFAELGHTLYGDMVKPIGLYAFSKGTS